MNERDVYRALRTWNDVKALHRAVTTGSTKPLTRRLGWRLYGKGVGRLGGRLFR